MSDTFDHEGDAWDSLNDEREDDLRGIRPSNYDPLHYHTYLCMNSDVVFSTPLALRVRLRQGRVEVWVPRRYVRYQGQKIFVWKKFYENQHQDNLKAALPKPVKQQPVPTSLDEASAADQREIQHNNVGEIQ